MSILFQKTPSALRIRALTDSYLAAVKFAHLGVTNRGVSDNVAPVMSWQLFDCFNWVHKTLRTLLV